MKGNFVSELLVILIAACFVVTVIGQSYNIFAYPQSNTIVSWTPLATKQNKFTPRNGIRN